MYREGLLVGASWRLLYPLRIRLNARRPLKARIVVFSEPSSPPSARRKADSSATARSSPDWRQRAPVRLVRSVIRRRITKPETTVFADIQVPPNIRLNARFHCRPLSGNVLGINAKAKTRMLFNSIDSVRKQIAEAEALARTAASDYRTGNEIRAAELQLAAERAWAKILKAIVGLTEEGADLVEHSFTELEEQLLNLPECR